jgi:hypothetical protein
MVAVAGVCWLGSAWGTCGGWDGILVGFCGCWCRTASTLDRKDGVKLLEDGWPVLCPWDLFAGMLELTVGFLRIVLISTPGELAVVGMRSGSVAEICCMMRWGVTPMTW